MTKFPHVYRKDRGFGGIIKRTRQLKHKAMESLSIPPLDNSPSIKLGMEDCSYMDTLHMGYPEFEALDEFKPPPQNYQNSLSSQKSYERPTKKMKTNTSWTNHHISPQNSSSSSSHIISFGDSCYGPTDHQPFCGNLDSFVEPKNEVLFYEDHRTRSPTSLKSYGLYDENKHMPRGGQGVKRGIGGMTRSPSHALDHVLAERKRRERLAERIIALSAIIPGLKKIDKASVLGDAIKYLKHLQERVKQLEEQAKKKSEELVVCINKSSLSAYEDSSSCENNSGGCFKESRCEIEARISEKNVLIRVHCEKKKGFVVKMIREIENLHLSVVNSSVLPFGSHVMDIAVVAQMDDEFGMTVEDLVRNLRSALL